MAISEEYQEISKADIFTHYMDYVTTTPLEQRGVEGMCGLYGFDEDAFYDHFLTLEELEKAIWGELMMSSIHTVKGDSNYVSFSDQDKLLSLFYTFFENLTLNKEYILINLADRKSLKERLSLLKSAKEGYSKFIDEVFSGSGLLGMAGNALGKLSELGQKGMQESFWVHCLCLIEFWKKDESVDNERTDIAIEKSVKAACDLIEAAPVRSVLDLGKFIWKERFGAV